MPPWFIEAVIGGEPRSYYGMAVVTLATSLNMGEDTLSFVEGTFTLGESTISMDDSIFLSELSSALSRISVEEASASTTSNLASRIDSTSAPSFTFLFTSLTPPPPYDISGSATLFSSSTPSRSPTPYITSPPSPSAPYISPTSSTLSSAPHSDVGIIAGAVAGGLAILAFVILILYFRRYKRKRSVGKNLDPRNGTFIQTPPENLDPRNGTVIQIPPEMAPDRAEDQSPHPSMSKMASDSSQELPTFAPPQQMFGRLLTDEQADFINDLQAGNMPSRAILHIMERMLARQEPSVVDDEDEPGSPPGGSSRRTTSMVSAPPSYVSEERVIVNE
ncbi:hypothetical protein BV22DRAFT_1193073 [Leucogyrophana mollusca]|uniref:Uncharacterized protein n=1 Tax=Leucogyrophana mollusca TaxID=85980 RepID=A0ACB8BQM4_9AGAM|nr:hypothetical protein BV22DRAFT_1193073 [Leucogyrophana mollusca]